MCVNIPSMEVAQEFNNYTPLDISVNKVESFTDPNGIYFENRVFLEYDDDSISLPPRLEEVDSFTNGSVFSAGNATFIPNHECFELEVEEPRYNYHGPKTVLPKRECPVTICTADTIGAVKSR